MQHLVGHSVVSLFAGIGGFDLGFHRAGFKIAAHVEKDDNCRKLLAAKWPDSVALDDVCTAGKDNLPACDVVTFGFPCQDLSVAGKRAGLAGGRSGLFYEATRIIDELQPAFALFENVPGLLSSDDGRDFARVLMEMDRIGYHGAWRVLDAQWFGVAQRRRRVFGLFSRLDSGAERCAEILSLEESLRGHPAPSREAGKGAAGSVAIGVGVSGTLDRKACGANRGSQANETEFIVPAVAGTLNASGAGTNRPAGQCNELDFCIPAVAGCLQERDAKGADSDTKPGHLVPVFGFGGESDASSLSGAGDLQPPVTGRHGAPGFVAHPVAQVQWASGGGKVHNPTAQALRSGAEHNYQFAQVGMQVRRLTPTECERLQGFPDGWTAGFSDSARYKMLGNAVCVNVAAWIAGMMAN